MVHEMRVCGQVYSPLTGTVVASNEAVEGKPGLVNSSPEEDGWLFKVLLQDEQEVKVQPIRGRSYEDLSLKSYIVTMMMPAIFRW